MEELEVFNKLKIGLASDEKIREWSHGEVKKPETINYRTLKPEKDGLFCEKIFGPTKDWECHCGKYKRVRYKGIVCDRCGVEVTTSKVRRERMGHIELAAPVAHIWYFKGIPSRIALMLDISPRNLEKVVYFASYIVTDKGTTDLQKCQVINEKEYHETEEKFGKGSFKAEMGAEALQKLLSEVDVEKLSEKLKAEIEKSSEQKRAKLVKRLDTVESFRTSNNKPEWMVMNTIPVIPPDLRPMVQLDGGRFATSDLNDLYRRVINRNNRLKRLLELGAPEIIVRNEKRMLQESVDALIDNGRRGRPVTGAGNRALKSLSDMLKGKQGRFRQNLLGKRVDYSGRSVIVVGPELKIYQCGLPKEMAVELFKPFVMRELVGRGIAHNIKNAKRMVEKLRPEVWDILEEVIQDHPVMLNRAPTLHRLGIQAFQPILVEGRAIKLHPLVCTAFNADFDGDQMAVHVPLTPEAIAEARFLMLSVNNLLKPQDGKPVTVPTQDMILGAYYLTVQIDGEKGEGMYFKDEDEAMLAYQNGDVGLHCKVKVRRFKEDEEGNVRTKTIETTVGRLIYNQGIPQDLGFVDRTDPEKEFDLEIDFPVIKKNLGTIVSKCINVHGLSETAEVLDYIKAIGYKYSTKGAITVSVADVAVPEAKKTILAKADEDVDHIFKQYQRGMITNDERYNAIIKIWEKATSDVTEAMKDNFDELNPIYMMAQSGARGNMNQLRQIAGMRGLMANTSGKAVEIPIKSCFREGLDALEYFISSHGARKGLADTALRTADSGYLTRRLVDVSQEIIIKEDDCGSNEGIELQDIKDGNQIIEGLEERLVGRFPLNDVINPETGDLIVDTNTMITENTAKQVVNAGIKKVYVRSILGCKCKHGACCKCYGMGLATRKLVNKGESVGIIAAQSIGEPGTQLTMRTFHTGGVAGGDITQGLPRVEELFEARNPKGLAIITEIAGKVTINDEKKRKEVTVVGKSDAKTYVIPFGAKLKVKDGDYVEAGDPLTEGSINPNDLLIIKGAEGVYKYIIAEVQKVYRNQGVDINDKHIEVIAKQMLRKVRVENPGDTKFSSASLVDLLEFEEVNEEMIKEGKRPATGKRVLLGITKASLATESFLSAASFQETTKVLTEAAIKGKVDSLIGLKENVIIGKLIPTGTGLKTYQDIEINTKLTQLAKKEVVPEKINFDEDDDEEELIGEQVNDISENNFEIEAGSDEVETEIEE